MNVDPHGGAGAGATSHREGEDASLSSGTSVEPRLTAATPPSTEACFYRVQMTAIEQAFHFVGLVPGGTGRCRMALERRVELHFGSGNLPNQALRGGACSVESERFA